MRSHDTAKLRHRISKSNAYTCCDRAVKGADPLRPDYGVCGTCARGGYYKTEVFNGGVGDGD